MYFYNLNDQTHKADFRTAAMNGQAPDKGLYFPERIPILNKEWFSKIENTTNEEIAYEVIRPYVGNSIPDDILFSIVKDSINFPIPLVEVSNQIFSLELYHGPTLAFKDIGARFMSQCLGYFLKAHPTGRKLTVLVATSGDTGGAVANSFYNIEGVNVVILFPSGKVSAVQEKQLTTPGNNVHALEVKGNFDDCQQMVKQAFTDESLRPQLFLTSANSINIARWLPQQFYYFFAWKQWKEKELPPVISVPSGNFGNICAGLLAQASGLPVKHFIAACNSNDVIPQYLETQKYIPKKAIPTISNAMDVGDPSNFKRILELFKNQFALLGNAISSCSISDLETKAAIKDVYLERNYLLDPHGAVAFLALKDHLLNSPYQKGIFLETAHPVKFSAVVEPLIDEVIEIPEKIRSLLKKKKLSRTIEPHFESLKEVLLKL